MRRVTLPVRRSRVGAALLGLCLLAEPAAAVAATTGTQARKTTPSTKSSSASSKKPTTSNAASKASTKKTSTKAQKSRSYSRARSQARRARLAKALAAQRARELREAMTPRYRVGDDGQLEPDLRAAAAVVYNPTTHEVLWEDNAYDTRSIASITKVMTAIVFLEHEVDTARMVAVAAEDVRGARHTSLRRGERVRVEDLLHLLLISSDNAAARTLARVSPFGPAGFVERMNAKAEELGLTQTHYFDPSGLYSANVSSAVDMAQLIAYASADERIAGVMRKRDYTLTTNRRTFSVHTTNRLVGSEIDVLGGKTGFIRNAGYCLATLVRLPQSNEEVALVVLGARSNNGRFWETRHLLNWFSQRTGGLLGGEPKVEPPPPDAPQDQPDDLP
jgi:D-alanyl-D-alanine endopeptidase (penicillin-binding protein 7)